MAQVFSFPFADLPRLSRREAARSNAIASWLGAWRCDGSRMATLLGGPLHARIGEVHRQDAADAEDGGATAVVRIGGAEVSVRVGSGTARRVAQQMIGGPEELEAARPADATEQALWAVVVAAALEDLGVAGEVSPVVDGEAYARADHDAVEIELTGALVATVTLGVPRALELRAPSPRPMAPWVAATALDWLIVVGRCALPRAALSALAPRDVVTLEPPVGGRAELVIGAGAIGLRVAPGAVEAAVATGYVVRDMALPDEAHLELTVALGSTRLSLRELTELAIGKVVSLGRPLAGPFELRAEGRVVGRGELVDVDGELGVRVVSLGE